MTFRLATAPASEPISLAEVKLHLKVDDTTEDTLIQAMTQAAREAAEHETGRSLMPQTWELLLDAFPADAIELDRPPVNGITSVQYCDTSGVLQTISSANYVLDGDYLPGYLIPANGYSWPSTADVANAVNVRFTTGYAGAAAVPGGVKAWMLLRIGALYRNREAFTMGSMADLPGSFVDRLLDPFKVYA